MDSYLYASLGFDLSERASSGLRRDLGYSSEYMLIFQKAVAAWWCGKPKESRMLFRRLKDEYGDDLSEYYFKLVEKNLMNLGSGPDRESSVKYERSKSILRFPFEGSEGVRKSVCGEVFVGLEIVGGPRALGVGCNEEE
jgi:hypothetical protein